MTVWIVAKTAVPDTEPGTLEEIKGFQEIIGIYGSEEKAREIQEELINQNAADVISGGAEPIDVTIDEYETI